jgi:hypothetical protein
MDGYHTLGWETFRLSCLLVWGVMAMAMMRWSRIELDLVKTESKIPLLEESRSSLDLEQRFGMTWHFFLDGYNRTL